jgi:hypothetical protein
MPFLARLRPITYLYARPNNHSAMPSATWMHVSRRRNTCNRNILSNKQPRSLVSNCSNFFNHPCVNLLCGDTSYVGAGKGLCVGVDVLSIWTLVRTCVNLAIMSHCSKIKTNIVSNLPAESPPTFGQWPGK